MSREHSAIEELAALYGQVGDMQFIAADVAPPSLEKLVQVYTAAHLQGMDDLANLLRGELWRLTNPDPMLEAYLSANAGLWRVH
ncbi:hypothetical protein [Roseateles saccharophilus]|uniref:Uncharacterized protein n=1 Tax=Roseateles saccharophilus TaxID=304 RepID=A0A4R3UKG9_ROSSA|nr:hypothetical protein [Roseateles saccharophilus]MDG0834187.1 hypothetical protein [Roseateles saccharophilus]TCU91292.1 hypothetical protein EV671_10267 [Roseateles saccharophilus]